MTPEELTKQVDKINKRVGYEWDQFMQANGTHWDELSSEGKHKACELAEMQAERWIKQGLQ